VIPQFEDLVRRRHKSKRTLDKLPETKEELDEQLKNMRLDGLKKVAEDALQSASADRKDWKEKRDKQRAKHVQRFMTSFSRYTDAYSGVVEIVRNAGSPYGPAAYSSLSLFLIARAR
jgi:hypothetical protein